MTRVRVFTLVVASIVLTVSTGLLSAAPAIAASIGALAGAGPRPGATRLEFAAGDSVQAQVDVGSGNLYVTVRGLSLPGARLGAYYNSAAAGQSSVPRLGRGWGLDYTEDVRLVSNSDFSATYHGPGGWTGVFTRTSGTATTYTSAPGFKSDLVKTSTGWTLTDRQSRLKRVFDTSGKLVSVADRNGNTTTVTASGSATFKDLTVVSDTGPTAARTATTKTDVYDVTTVRQPNVANPREVKFERTDDTMTRFRDALQRETTFDYDSNGLLIGIDAPGGVSTTFGYNSAGKVTSITQLENASGGPGSSVTRLTYPSATQTLLAAPDTNQSQPVSAVPHTTYTLNSSQRVTNTIDAAGRTRSATYTANFDALTAAIGAGAETSTTTNTFGANAGESLTSVANPTGATSSLAYTNPAGPSLYLPSSSTDDAGNATAYTYNGAGNQMTVTQPGGAQAKVTRNSDGTIATATAPANGTNSSTYGYTNKLLTSVTAPTGTSLGARAYTYNAYGLLATATNGRGITATYTYDAMDRVTKVAYTGGQQVTFDYDTAGRMDTRTDANGTTSYDYDQLNRLTARSNTFYGGTISYAYDKASNLASVTSAAGGTTTYSYDAAGVPTEIFYPHAGEQRRLAIETDSRGRRTGTWLQSNVDHTVWQARNQTTYDNSGRVARVTADTGTGDSDYTRVVDISYCYMAGTIAPTCTANAANDRNKLQWQKDNLTGAITKYTYDTSGRLTKAQVTGAGAITYNYTYNSNDNRLTASAQSQTLTYNAGNQITSSGYSYDGAGNLTAQPGNGTMTYTSADQLASVTKSGTTYTYKHAGTSNDELLYQNTPEGTYQYAYGRTNTQGLPVVEAIKHENESASVTSDPVTGQPLMLRSSSGMQSLYVYDGRPGSPIALLTSGAYEAFAYNYDPFGVPTLTEDSGGLGTTENPYLFAGGVQDRVTGWVHYGARYYDPKTGSFTQQDSLDAPLTSCAANRYAYAGNDPINITDPTGYLPCASEVLGNVFYYGGTALLCGGIALGTAGVGGVVCEGIAFVISIYIPFDANC